MTEQGPDVRVAVVVGSLNLHRLPYAVFEEGLPVPSLGLDCGFPLVEERMHYQQAFQVDLSAHLTEGYASAEKQIIDEPGRSGRTFRLCSSE